MPIPTFASSTTPSTEAGTNYSIPVQPVADSAELIVQALIPNVSEQVLERLRSEELLEADLVELDNTDLRELGLRLLERARILRWSRAMRNGGLTPMSVRPGAGLDLARSIAGSENTTRTPAVPEVEEELARISTLQVSADAWCVFFDQTVMQRISHSPSIQVLTKVTGGSVREIADSSRRDRAHTSLEKFNVTAPRILKVFLSMLRAEGTKEDAETEDIYTIEQFQKGLTSLHLDDLDVSAVQTVFDLVRGLGGISYQEFSTACTRLKMAQVIGFLEMHADTAEMTLELMDFDLDNLLSIKYLSTFQDLRQYFFSRRPIPLLSGGSLYGSTRWINVTGHRALLIALMMKYNFNPLAIEAILREGPTKVEFHGDTSLITIEHLSVVNSGGSAPNEPVQVEGSHVSILTCGSAFSTVCTIVQPSRSFEQDWPGPGLHDDDDKHYIITNAWISRIRALLRDADKRPRLNQAQSFVLEVLSQLTEDQVQLTHAYSDRLALLERHLGQELEHGNVPPRSWPAEVMQSQQQLHLVTRQIKLLRHLIHRIINSPAMTMNGQLAPNFSELYELLDSCRTEAEHCMARCDFMGNSYDLALTKKREHEEKLQRDIETHHKEQQNKVMFTMSAYTVIFAPVQFMSSVYGMNFWDVDKGQSAMPEITSPNGYFYFWIGIGVYLATCFLVAMIWWKRSRFRSRASTLSSSSIEDLNGNGNNSPRRSSRSINGTNGMNGLGLSSVMKRATSPP